MSAESCIDIDIIKIKKNGKNVRTNSMIELDVEYFVVCGFS